MFIMQMELSRLQTSLKSLSFKKRFGSLKYREAAGSSFFKADLQPNEQGRIFLLLSISHFLIFFDL